MVKLGTNLHDKGIKQASVEDGVRNAALMTPLDVNRLRHAPPDMVVVKTRAEYQTDQKRKGRLSIRRMEGLTISLKNSEKVKVTILVFLALAFLGCVVFLVVYKTFTYNHSCPDGFMHKYKRCVPAALEGHYRAQDSSSRGHFFMLISHYSMAKQTASGPASSTGSASTPGSGSSSGSTSSSGPTSTPGQSAGPTQQDTQPPSPPNH